MTSGSPLHGRPHRGRTRRGGRRIPRDRCAGGDQPVRSTSTPGWRPTRCASSSVNCSTPATDVTRARWPARLRRRSPSSPPPSGPASWTGARDDVTQPACGRWCDHRLAVAHPGYDRTNRRRPCPLPTPRPSSTWPTPVRGDRRRRRGDARPAVERRHRGMAGRRPPRQRQGAGAEGHDWFIDVTTERRYEILDRQLFVRAASSSNTSCTPPATTANRSHCGSAS